MKTRSLLICKQGNKYGDQMIQAIKSRSALKHEVRTTVLLDAESVDAACSQTFLDDCADTFCDFGKEQLNDRLGSDRWYVRLATVSALDMLWSSADARRRCWLEYRRSSTIMAGKNTWHIDHAL
jgi:hypothetical protein